MMNNVDFSRRNSLNIGVFVGLGSILFSSFTNKFDSSIQNDKIVQIGENSLLELRNKYHSELFDHFLPNMDKFIIDHELGGFMCDVDIKNGKQLSTKKRAWFEGRGIWLYSFLYNHFNNNEKYLEIATKSKDFILKHIPNDDSFWVSSYTREGVPLSDEGDIFCNLYIAEGLAEYSKASGDIEYFNLAKKILMQCVRQYDREDYEYSAEESLKGPRVLNHWMIMLSNATQMLNHKDDSEIAALAERCVNAIMNNHLNPDWQLLDITLAHDFTRLSDPKISQKVSFGLGVQALWMVLAEAVRVKDAELFNRAQILFRRHVEVAKDNVYGGYYWSLEDVSSFTFKLGKTLSLHDEILIGSLMLMEHQSDKWAIECFSGTYNYVIKNFMKPDYLFAVENGDRNLINFSDKGVGIYHHPRQLVLNLLAIERIIERKGKVSEVFAST